MASPAEAASPPSFSTISSIASPRNPPDAFARSTASWAASLSDWPIAAPSPVWGTSSPMRKIPSTTTGTCVVGVTTDDGFVVAVSSSPVQALASATLSPTATGHRRAGARRVHHVGSGIEPM